MRARRSGLASSGTIHFADHRIEVLTAEGIEGILGIQWSRIRMGPSGELWRGPSATM